jgi:tyrosine-protein kinase Etk/Wzc
MNNKKNVTLKTNTFINYLDLVRNNLKLILLISSIIFIVTTIYAVVAPDIYSSSVTLKITAPKGNILSGKLGDIQDLGGLANDRYIATEIQTIYNSDIMYQVANTIVDSFKITRNTDDFSLIFDKSYFQNKGTSVKKINEIAKDISSSVKVDQKENLDFIEITAESQSPNEAALIANTLANKYKLFNLLENRKQITIVKEFLGNLLKEKKQQLYNIEDSVKEYQLAKGGVQLDVQAQLLISKLADFESQKNAAKVSMSIAKEKLNQYKGELEKKDPSVSNFLSNKSSEPYLKKLQEEIANLETQRDIALASSKSGRSNEGVVKEYNSKIDALKDKLNKSLTLYRNQITSSSPEEIKDLSQKIFEEEINYQSLSASYGSLSNVLNNYEAQFNRLPSSTLEFARLERQRMAEENLYNILNTKYQEAQLNEQAVPSNVHILNEAYPSVAPSKPNRILTMIMGLLLGFGFAFGFVYAKNYFDKTIKTPEDIEANNINVLAWIPKFSSKDVFGLKNPELIVAQKPESIPSEAFRTIRTRLQFLHLSKGSKSILITSPAPGEGKTTVAVNLAVSFALANKKTLIIDGDLRKPRLYSLFGEDDKNGFLDYLFGQVQYEKIIKRSGIKNLDYMTAGSIPSNPSEVLGLLTRHQLWQSQILKF